jgi:CRISPR-associated protein Cmr3
MKLFIEPADVLLFRDGRPFSAGEGHRARSLFPPTPNTIQGVIRSKVLTERCGQYHKYKHGCSNCPQQANCTIPDEIGRPAQDGQGNYGAMQLKGVIIAQGKPSEPNLTHYFPIPADVVQVKNKQNPLAEAQLVNLKPLAPQDSPPGVTDITSDSASKLLTLWTPEPQPVDSAIGYWAHPDLQKYLLGEELTSLISADQLFQKESRYGIEVDYSLQTVKEGRLYQTEFVRCQEGVGLYIEIEGIQSLSPDPEPDRGLLSIGGENKAATYQKQSGIDWDLFRDMFKEKWDQANGFKLYLATPTIFEQGWLPKWINPDTLTGQFPSSTLTVNLVAAAISRYQTIGGWDVAYNRHKPTRRAVAAGSVYYFTTEASPEDILQAFHWQNLADDIKDAQIGYGLGLVGLWNYCSFELTGENK